MILNPYHPRNHLLLVVPLLLFLLFFLLLLSCSQSQSANNDLFSSNEPKLTTVKENFEMPKYEKHNEKKEGVYDDPKNLYFLNSMGFNKDQLKVNLPENLNIHRAGRCCR